MLKIWVLAGGTGPDWQEQCTETGQLHWKISADIKVALSSFALEPSSFVVFPCPHLTCHTNLLVLSLYVPMSSLYPFDHLHLLGSDPLTWSMKTQTLHVHHSSLCGNHTSCISLFTCVAGLFSVLVQMINPYHFLHGSFPLAFILRQSELPILGVGKTILPSFSYVIVLFFLFSHGISWVAFSGLSAFHISGQWHSSL